jgi:hypothetical protein
MKIPSALSTMNFSESSYHAFELTGVTKYSYSKMTGSHFPKMPNLEILIFEDPIDHDRSRIVQSGLFSYKSTHYPKLRFVDFNFVQVDSSDYDTLSNLLKFVLGLPSLIQVKFKLR